MGELHNRKVLEALSKAAIEIYAQPEILRPDDEGLVAEMFAEDGEFDPRATIAILLDTNPSYYGHKEALLAAFSSWTISPSDEDMQLQFVASSIKASLKRAEQLAQEFNEDLSPVESDMLARYVIAGPQFIENLYYPLTGMDLLAEFGAPETIETIAEGKERRLYTLLRMMNLCHYWSSGNGASGAPSVNRSINVVERLPDPDTVTRSGIYDAWAELKSNIALIYAADSIDLGADESLLESFMNGTVDFDLHYPVFHLWMRRARFVCDMILSKMPDRNLHDLNVSLLSDVEGEPFPHTAFSPRELNEMNNAGL
jgi:hypothetical protein